MGLKYQDRKSSIDNSAKPIGMAIKGCALRRTSVLQVAEVLTKLHGRTIGTLVARDVAPQASTGFGVYSPP